MADAPKITTEPAVMLMEDFLRHESEAGPFEYYNGEIIPLMPQPYGHSKLEKRLFLRLLPFEEQGLGEVFSETTFVLTDNPKWVRGSRTPHVMFILKSTLDHFYATISDPDPLPFILVPEFVIEIVSPTDDMADVLEKAETYLRDGVTLVWVVAPRTKQVIVRTAGVDIGQIYTGDTQLNGAPVLPDFNITLHELFA